jgi:hypothetical protein
VGLIRDNHSTGSPLQRVLMGVVLLVWIERSNYELSQGKPLLDRSYFDAPATQKN